MMTKMAITMMAVLMLTLMIWSNNMMKTSFFILIISLLMMFTMYLKTGISWMPMIYMMIFTGGILMMFMMLSSILPNQKSMKMKSSKLILIILSLSPMLSFYLNQQNQFIGCAKSFLSSNFNFLLMMTLMTIYFFSSMEITTQEEYSLRSFFCWKNDKFCKFISMNQQ